MTPREIAEKTWKLWSDYIKLDNVNKDIVIDEIVADIETYKKSYVGLQPSDKFLNDLRTNEHLVQLCGMKYRLSAYQVKALVEIFINEQLTFGKMYRSNGECIKHCTYWIGSNVDKAPKEAVKSNGKILGL
jgi:hypothetical protein